MSSHEMASQTTAVQNEIPTTVRLSEYLRPESRADAIAMRRIASDVGSESDEMLLRLNHCV